MIMIFSIDLIQYKMKLLRFKVFHAICMHQFGWLSNFLNLLQKEEVPRTGEVPQKGGGGSTKEETVIQYHKWEIIGFVYRND